MKNHFFMPYNGNKRMECEDIYEFIKNNLNDIEYIIEPFCGSSAFSYYLSTLHPKKFKYILNDNNDNLIKLYNIFKDDKKTNEFIIELNKLLPIDNKEKYYEIINKNDIYGYLVSNKLYNIRAGLYPQGKKINDNVFNNIKKSDIIHFLRNENITITNDNYKKVLDEYINNPKALIFLDPPYTFTNNCFYKNPDFLIYEFLCDEELKNYKSLIAVCIENNFFIKQLFKKYKNITYSKKYQTSKKNTEHILFTNKLV